MCASIAWVQDRASTSAAGRGWIQQVGYSAWTCVAGAESGSVAAGKSAGLPWGDKEEQQLMVKVDAARAGVGFFLVKPAAA